MPILHSPSQYAYYTVGDSLTEQEHKELTDANVMIKRAINGQSIHTKKPGSYGYDDTTLDGLTHRIMKKQLEEELNETFEQEFEEAEAELLKKELPESFHKRIKIKRKQDSELQKPMGTMASSTDPKLKETSKASE